MLTWWQQGQLLVYKIVHIHYTLYKTHMLVNLQKLMHSVKMEQMKDEGGVKIMISFNPSDLFNSKNTLFVHIMIDGYYAIMNRGIN